MGWGPPQFNVKYELFLEKVLNTIEIYYVTEGKFTNINVIDCYIIFARKCKFIILNTFEIYYVTKGELINIYLVDCYITFARECNITVDCNITQQIVFLFAYSGQNIILCIFIVTGHCK